MIGDRRLAAALAGIVACAASAALGSPGVAVAQTPSSDGAARTSQDTTQASLQEDATQASSQEDASQEDASQASPQEDAAQASRPEDGAAQTPPQDAETAAAGETPYTVECGPDPDEGRDVCQVDRGTYVGWRTYHAVCHTCHAQDAVGSTFAPALLPRIREIDKERFIAVVDEGFSGQIGVMPAWGENPNVNRYYDELWSYLKARADGVLRPGRPERLPEP